MFQQVCPKLPMRTKANTLAFYGQLLGFELIADYGDYLLLKKEQVELHFFEYSDLQPTENYGQVYIRVQGIHQLYQDLLDRAVPIHPNGTLRRQPWGQWEFALLDPDNNLLTFGQPIR